MRCTLLLAAFGAAQGVHVHLAPAAGVRGTLSAGGKSVAKQEVRSSEQRSGLDRLDLETVKALYCADGPVQPLSQARNTSVNATWSIAVPPDSGLDAALQFFSLEPANVSEATEAKARSEKADPDFPVVQPSFNDKASWIRIIVRMAIVIGCATVIFGIVSIYHEVIYQRTGLKVEHICCAAYAALSISIDLSIKNASKVNGGHYPFNVACSVVTVECLKLIVSVILFGVNARADLKAGKEIVWPGAADIGWLMVPGFVYTCNNIIVWKAIGLCPLGTFGVIRETMLIWNAVLWTVVFRAPVGRMRWFSILLLFLGCVVNQLPAFFRAEFTWGVLWAVLLAFSNAAGGVANEYAMKRKAAMDINLQNCILYFFCGSFGMIYLAVFQLGDLQAGFFNGFSPQCIQAVIIQVLTGLAVSRILKYVDAITKTIVAALRGPGVIFFGAWIFHTVLHWSEVVATIVVCFACYLYLREGPLVKPKEEPAPAKIAK